MTRYTTNKYGIIIGYGGWFFMRSSVGEHKDYPAILWLENFNLKQINSANYHIQTPAQQFMFHRETREWPDHHTAFVSGDVEIGLPPVTTTHYVLNNFMRRWLNDNSPGWSTYPIEKDMVDTNEQTLFFTRVKHARAWRDFVSKMIAGTPATYSKNSS